MLTHVLEKDSSRQQLVQVVIGACGVQVGEEKIAHKESKSLGKRKETSLTKELEEQNRKESKRYYGKVY